jgi:alkylation response protein AidB-like acyl-CoA dehydrogenase
VATSTHPQSADFRATVQAFLAEHLPPGWTGLGSLDRSSAARFVEAWRALLHEHGLLAVAWPKEHGGAGLTKLEQVIVAEGCSYWHEPIGLRRGTAVCRSCSALSTNQVSTSTRSGC